MPKIAIDISPLHDGNSVRGVGVYTGRLIRSLKAEISKNPRYKNYTIDLIESPDSAKSNHYDLVHYPYFDPFKLSLPKNQQTPFIVTVHDLIPLEFKKHFPVGIRGAIKWLIQKNTVKKAKYILTVSHHSKYSISKILGYPADHIYPTYLAADDIFRPIKDKTLLNKIKTKYNLPDKFILYMGDVNWNKNIPTLVKACLELRYPLVIVGSAVTKPAPVHPWTEDLRWVQQKYQQLGGKSNSELIFAGYAPDEDLPSFYNLATAYCQPSFAEGFGFAHVQAMQSGCPVVYSDRGSMAEIMDYSGLMFNPESIESLKKALSTYWNHPKVRQQYIKKGLNRAKYFDWKFTALQTLAVYDLALIDEKIH
jgi:glycosyltransferase involved in cell wall biosynthesis